MPSGLTLLHATPAAIPTPSAGKATIFLNSSAGDTPYYKDDAGAVHPLTGAIGPPGPPTSAGVILTAPPATPSDYTYWMESDNGSPEAITLYIQISGVAYPFASFTLP